MSELEGIIQKGLDALKARDKTGFFRVKADFSGLENPTRKRQPIDNTSISGISGFSGLEQSPLDPEANFFCDHHDENTSGVARASTLIFYPENPEHPEKSDNNKQNQALNFSGCIQPNPESPEKCCVSSTCKIEEQLLVEVVSVLADKTDAFQPTCGGDRQLARDHAVDWVRARLLNHPALAPTQHDTWRCLVCNERDLPNNPIAPFLTPIPDKRVWVHLDCHDHYRRGHAAKADALIQHALNLIGI